MFWIKREICTGCLDCLDACNTVGALVVHHGLPAIDATRCSSCGACVRACPVGAIVEVPTDTPSRHKPVETLEIDAPSHSQPATSIEVSSTAERAPVKTRTQVTKRDRLAELGITPERTVQVLKAIGTVGGTILSVLASQKHRDSGSDPVNRTSNRLGASSGAAGNRRGHRRRGRRRRMW